LRGGRKWRRGAAVCERGQGHEEEERARVGAHATALARNRRAGE